MRMQATKNNLSGGLARLDYEALIIVAKIATREILEKIDQHRQKVRDSIPVNHLHGFLCESYLNAQWLREASQELEIATETLATLVGGLEDRKVEIVNKTNGL